MFTPIKRDTNHDAVRGIDTVGAIARQAAERAGRNGKQIPAAQEKQMSGFKPIMQAPASRVVDPSVLARIPGTPEYRAAKGGLSKIALPSYDTGIDSVPEDQVALIHEGEKVVPADENPDNKQPLPVAEPSAPAVQSRGVMRSDENPEQTLIAPAAQSHGVLRSDENPEATLIPAEKPTKGGVLADQFLKHIGAAPEPITSDVDKSGGLQVGMPKIVAPQEMSQQAAGGALIPSAPTSETPSEQRDLRNMERKAKVANLEKQRQDALASGDLTTADKLAVAKAQLEKTPWSDRSMLSKIGKVAGTIGNVAGDVIAPGVMAQVPGTDLNKALRAQGAYNRIAPDTEADYKQAQINAAQSKEKSPAQQVYDWAIAQHKTPDEALAMSQGTGKTPEEKFQDWAMTGNNGKPQTDESGQPYTQLSAHQAWQAQAPEKGADKPLGVAVPNVNKALTDRYQVLNPGKALPPEFTLGKDAKQADFDRIDKLMESTEKATATQAQQQQIKADKDKAATESKRRFEQTASRKDIARHDSDYVKPAEATETSYEKMQHAFDEFEVARSQGKELPTGAQSMLALSTHLATTFGGVKGSRITKDMIQEHLGARGVTDRALVAIQRLTNGDVLSPDQWAAFHELISSTRDIAWQTAVREADRKHIPTDFLPDGLTAVKVEGHKAGIIHSDKLAEFQKKYPDAEVLSGEKE